MKSSSPPPAPDPYATAQAQTTSNIDTAVANSIMNNATIYSPYGSTSTVETGQTYDTSGHLIPQFATTIALSPDQQRLYDQQTQLGIKTNDIALSQADKIGGILGTPVAATPTLKTISDYLPGTTLTDTRDKVQDALMQRLNPQLDRSRSALETELVNQGLVRGTAAFDAAMDEENRNANDARLATIAQAGQEEDRTFNEAAGLASSYDTAAQQGWQNDLTARTQPINEISALMGLGQVTPPQSPGFQTSQVAGTPVGQYVYQSYQGNLDAWKAQQAAQAQTMGGLFGLGGSIASAGLFGLAKSDRRLKRDIVRLGLRTARGFNLYSYRLAGEARREAGVMADEVERVLPAAVILMPDGFKAVDYAQVM